MVKGVREKRSQVNQTAAGGGERGEGSCTPNEVASRLEAVYRARILRRETQEMGGQMLRRQIDTHLKFGTGTGEGQGRERRRGRATTQTAGGRGPEDPREVPILDASSRLFYK